MPNKDLHSNEFERDGTGEEQELVIPATSGEAYSELRTALLNEILHSMPDLVFAKNEAGVIIAANPAYAELAGRTIEQLVSHTDHELFPKEEADVFRENDLKTLKSGVKNVNEEWVVYPDGRHVLLETTKLPLKLPTGECKGILGMSRDITRRRRAEERIRENEAELRLYFDRSPFGIAILDENGHYLDGNAATSRILARPREEIGLVFFGEKQPLEIRKQLMDFFEALRKHGRVSPSDFSVFADNGVLKHLEIHAFRLRKDRYILFFNDITKRKAAERSLRQQEALSRAVSEAANLLLAGGIDIQNALQRTLEQLCKAAEADGAYVWQTEKDENGDVHGVRGFVWGASQPVDEWNFDALFNDHSDQPMLKCLEAGDSYRYSTEEMNERSRDYLSSIGIKSLLIVPIFMDGGFWGFMGLDDFTHGRRWSQAKDDIMRNAGLLIATAIRHQEMLEELKESNQRFKDTIAATGELLWEIDLKGRYAYLSDRFFDYTNLRPEDFIGRPMDAFMHPEDARAAQEEMGALAAGELDVIRGFEFRGMNSEGRYSWYRATAIALRDELGRARSFRGTTGMIQAEKEAKENLQQTLETLAETNAELERSTLVAQELAQKAEQASSAKSQFLATMSHEIRTPLNGVIGMSELLMGTELNQKQFEYARLVKESGRSLLYLINDILDFSKIEAGKLEIERIPFNLHEVAESVLGILAERATKKKLELCGVCEPDVPHVALGDEARIRQVLVNLLGNAVKFTTHGGVRLELSVDRSRPATKERVTVLFKVVDTGIGIPKDRQDRLFKAFSQVDSSQSRKYGGTGLGLAISAQLARLLDGDIGVESQEGKGTTFWFRVPLETNLDAISERGAKPSVSSLRHGHIDLSGRTALVVDGNHVLRSALLEQLRAWNMDVTAFESNEEAMVEIRKAEVANKPFHLLIADSSPEDNGIELVRSLDIETPSILLVPLTEEIDHRELASLASTKLLSKPVYSSPLFNAIIEAIAQRDPELRELYLEAEKGNTPKKRSELGNRYRAADGRIPTILVAEDNRINQIVIQELLTNFGFLFDIVSHGGEAIEALRAKKYDLILMDCQMPEVDGFEATRRIRRMESEKGRDFAPGHPVRIPIIALTANATKHDEAATLSVGMDAYCSKPINADRLFDTICAQLNRS